MGGAGLKSLFPMSDLSVMGVVEVLMHAHTLTQRIKQTVSAIIKEKPDIVLTIDSPGFAKSVVKAVRKKKVMNNTTKFYHVVAPQVWAWGEKRAKKYAKMVSNCIKFKKIRSKNSSGGLSDYLSYKQNILSVTVELGSDNLIHPIKYDHFFEIKKGQEKLLKRLVKFVKCC